MHTWASGHSLSATRARGSAAHLRGSRGDRGRGRRAGRRRTRERRDWSGVAGESDAGCVAQQGTQGRPGREGWRGAGGVGVWTVLRGGAPLSQRLLRQKGRTRARCRSPLRRRTRSEGHPCQRSPFQEVTTGSDDVPHCTDFSRILSLGLNLVRRAGPLPLHTGPPRCQVPPDT